MLLSDLYIPMPALLRKNACPQKSANGKKNTSEQQRAKAKKPKTEGAIISSRAARVRVKLSSFGSPPRPRASGDPKHVLIKPVHNHGLIKIEFPFDEEINTLLRALVTTNG